MSAIPVNHPSHAHIYIEWNCNTYCAPCIYTCNHVLYAYTVCMCAWQNKSVYQLYLHALLHLLQYINLYRSATRCLFIPFAKPSLKVKVSSHYKLNKRLPPVSGGIVYLIDLGKRFHAEGMKKKCFSPCHSTIRSIKVVL